MTKTFKCYHINVNAKPEQVQMSDVVVAADKDGHDALIAFMRRDFGGGGSSCFINRGAGTFSTQTADGQRTWFVKEAETGE